MTGKCETKQVLYRIATALLCCWLTDQCSASQDGGIAKLRVKRAYVKNATCLSVTDKQIAVDLHNNARSTVTPTATNMMRMIWDEELGQKAQQYSRECTWGHSSNSFRKTSNFSYLGENLYISSYEDTMSMALRKAMQGWDGERAYYTFDTKKCLPGKMCGHYTQVAWATSYAVGCGMTWCHNVNVRGNTWPEAQLVVCHYGPGGNIVGRSMYGKGQSCTSCPGMSSCTNNLCPSLFVQAKLTDNRCSADHIGSQSALRTLIFSSLALMGSVSFIGEW